MRENYPDAREFGQLVLKDLLARLHRSRLPSKYNAATARAKQAEEGKWGRGRGTLGEKTENRNGADPCGTHPNDVHGLSEPHRTRRSRLGPVAGFPDGFARAAQSLRGHVESCHRELPSRSKLSTSGGSLWLAAIAAVGGSARLVSEQQQTGPWCGSQGRTHQRYGADTTHQDRASGGITSNN